MALSSTTAACFFPPWSLTTSTEFCLSATRSLRATGRWAKGPASPRSRTSRTPWRGTALFATRSTPSARSLRGAAWALSRTTTRTTARICPWCSSARSHPTTRACSLDGQTGFPRSSSSTQARTTTPARTRPRRRSLAPRSLPSWSRSPQRTATARCRSSSRWGP
eukprot:Amastigsp_a851941_16.p3 type:complete len:165 gc:universal Amastigsp_a851941_16:648-154(-)